MSDLSNRINAGSDELFGELTPSTTAKNLGSTLPVLATPAIAAGVATAAAFAAGYAVEEAGDK